MCALACLYESLLTFETFNEFHRLGVHILPLETTKTALFLFRIRSNYDMDEARTYEWYEH